MSFETQAGIYESEIVGTDVKVRMSDPADVRLNFPLQLDDGIHNISFANSGVPHVLFFAEDLEGIDVFGLGRQTRYHDDFKPAGTNANFVRVKDSQAIDIRTYERGVEDETLACGTGSIAAAVVSAALGKVTSPVAVKTASGSVLTIHFDLVNGKPESVYLEGDAGSSILASSQRTPGRINRIYRNNSVILAIVVFFWRTNEESLIDY